MYTLALAALMIGLISGPFTPRAWGDDNDAGMTSIHKIDLQQADTGPAAPDSYIGFDLNIKRLKIPGAHANVILRQMTKRVRIEFEGAGVPRGKYVFAVASGCPSGHLVTDARYKAAWTEMHRFTVSETHIATEKSQPKVALRSGGDRVLLGKSLGFFKVAKAGFELIDCREIK